ncbi:hypothetical protein TrST_g13847 [Triparma strigata]|uniref:GP-PDE domain-containing protein n=1 Tax=Triparma strigata TaxID=1606541 RepID=A0A9W7EVJ5_9STRA|nr:hypothetical protein TrST_g13847 [Triparma strigata]
MFPSSTPSAYSLTSALSSHFSPPTLLLLTSVVCPLLWPFLFFSWPILLFHIHSHRALLKPTKESRKQLPAWLQSTTTRLNGKIQHNKVTIIPHRGGSGEAPENTLQSFRLNGLNHIDLKKTLDHHVVCFHDQEPHERNMLKLTGRDASLRSFDLCRLPPLMSRIPSNPLCDYGYISCEGREGRKIPQFTEVCSLSKPMFLELWDDDFNLVETVHEHLRVANQTHNVIWGNRFSTLIQSMCQEVNSSIPVMSTAPQMFNVYVLYYLGLLPFVGIKGFDVFMVVLVNVERWRKLFTGAFGEEDSTPYFVADFFISRIITVINYFLRAPKLFTHLKLRGIPVVGFVVNDEEDWDYCVGLGFDGIITDYPKRCEQFLRRKRGLTSPVLQNAKSAGDDFSKQMEKRRKEAYSTKL